MSLRNYLRQKGINRNNIIEIFLRSVTSRWFLILYLTSRRRRAIVQTGDPVRYGTVCLAIEQLSKTGVPGSLAECGVYKGLMSKFIHENFPDRMLYLFDTFQGFAIRDSNTKNDDRFKDTSEESVLKCIGDTHNISIRKGLFPETAIGLENERFSFVLIDFDKYESTLEALKFFYPRTNSGGFIFVHDYSSPESVWACSKALNEFLVDKQEKPILIPDSWGTALFRKF
jgi:O-methyltransferase